MSCSDGALCYRGAPVATCGLPERGGMTICPRCHWSYPRHYCTSSNVCFDCWVAEIGVLSIRLGLHFPKCRSIENMMYERTKPATGRMRLVPWGRLDQPQNVKQAGQWDNAVRAWENRTN